MARLLLAVALLAVLGDGVGRLPTAAAQELTTFDLDLGSPGDAANNNDGRPKEGNRPKGNGFANRPKDDGNGEPALTNEGANAANEAGEAANNTLLYSHTIIGFANATSLETSRPTAGPTTATEAPTPPTEHPLAGTELPDNCARAIGRWDPVKGKVGGKGKGGGGKGGAGGNKGQGGKGEAGGKGGAGGGPGNNGPGVNLRPDRPAPVEPRSGGPWRRLQANKEWHLEEVEAAVAAAEKAAAQDAAKAANAEKQAAQADAQAADQDVQADQEGVPADMPPELYDALPPNCQEWLAKNPFGMPSRSPTPGPTRGPTPAFEVESFVDVTVVNATADVVDGSDIAAVQPPTQTATVSLTYQLDPTDDTFLEAFRDDEILGGRDKLKVDATPGGVPTKVAQLQFALAEVFDEARARAIYELKMRGYDVGADDAVLELNSATLKLFSLTSSKFGGYVSEIPAEANGAAARTEETAAWEDYAKGFDFGPDKKEREAALALLPAENEALATLGAVAPRRWNEVDLTARLAEMFGTEGENNLALRISTDSSDGVIYASKEASNGRGPVLALEFEVSATKEVVAEDVDAVDAVTTTTVPPVPVAVRPFKPGEAGLANQTPNAEGDAGAAITEEGAVETSVVSSSFRMTVTALETARRRLGAGRRAVRRRELDAVPIVVHAVPTIDEKERPAVEAHLAEVFRDVLSIVPVGLSLVFEGALEQRDVSLGAGEQGLDGVVRESVFRVIAIFDDPGVSATQSDKAAAELDKAVEHAFLEPAFVNAFVATYKSHGERIVDDPSEYEVAVLKVDYAEELQGAAAAADNRGGAPANGAEGGDNTTNATWLEPALIAGAATLVVFASSAAVLLWRQRHRGGDGLPAVWRKPGKDGDTPRSAATAPTTPSPNVFAHRFKGKKKTFDYAEFEDDDVERDLSEGEEVVLAGAEATAYLTEGNRLTRDGNVVFDRRPDASVDESSVSDVSAHLLGAKGSAIKNNAAAESESFLLDTTMDSYQMEAMSALDQVRFENVLQMSASSPGKVAQMGKVNVDASGARVRDAIEEDRSHDTGEVPSELYSDQSMDSSSMLGTSSYGGHLFPTLEMLRKHDSSLLDLPPPPSDAESEASSQPDHSVGEDDVRPLASEVDPTGPASTGDIANAPVRAKAEQDAVSESINDELAKVMKLLGGGPSTTKPADESMDGGATFVTTPFNTDDSVVHIGNVRPPVKVGDAVRAWNARAAANDADAANAPTETPTEAGPGGINILVDDGSTTTEADENDPLKIMNDELSDCMTILEKARANLRKTPAPYAGEDMAGKSEDEAEEDETSLVTERIDE